MKVIDWEEFAQQTIQLGSFRDYLMLAMSNPFLFTLITAVSIDVISGVSASAINHKLDSSVGFKGIVKHTTLLLLAVLLEFLGAAVNIKAVGNTFCLLAISNYVISILGNLAAIGFVIPKWIAKPLKAEIDRKINKTSDD